MTNNLPSLIKAVIALLALCLASLVFIGVSKSASPLSLGNTPDQIFQRFNVVGTNASPYDLKLSATNTYAISTSTVAFNGDYGYDTLSLNIKVINASTTGANTITLTPTFSNDLGCASSTDTNINWFTSQDTASRKNATSSSFAANTTTYRKIDIINLATKCIKLVTYGSHASSTIFIDGLMK
jgi:hypothetical protein